MRIAALQPQADAGPGYLTSWAAENGVALAVFDATDENLPDAKSFDAAVVLGSDASWAASPRPAWMTRLLYWMAEAELAQTRLLGVCFGAQALATLHGGEVTQLPEPEVGWVKLDLSDGARISAGPWLSWHGDHIRLPDNAHELARTGIATHAFTIGDSAGVQFHPEATPEAIAGWVSEYAGRDLGTAVDSADALLSATARNAEAAKTGAYALFDLFAQTAMTEVGG